MRAAPRLDVGWVSWAVLFIVIVIILTTDSDRRGVSHVNEEAAQHWIEAEPLYTDGYKGYLYAPQSAMAYVPFLYPTEIIGSFLWRLLGLALLTTGLYQLLRRFPIAPVPATATDTATDTAPVPATTTTTVTAPATATATTTDTAPVPATVSATAPVTATTTATATVLPTLFPLASFLLIPVAISSLRNGQSNLHLAGVFLLFTVAWIDGKRWRAGAWMIAGLLAKPLAIVLALLSGATNRALIIALVMGLVVFSVLPFVHAQPDYAWEQIQAFVEKSKQSSDPDDHVYANIEGIFHQAGQPIPKPVRRPLQIAAALATLLLAFWARGRVRPGAFPFAVMTLAALYLMLFNPRTEANSYVILGGAVALLGAFAWTSTQRADAWFLTAIAVALGSDNYGRWLHGATDRWFKPTVAIVFLVYFLWRLAQAPNRPLLPPRDDDPGSDATIPA